MQRSLPRLVRQGNLLSGIFSRSKETTPQLTKEEQSKLREALPTLRSAETSKATSSGQEVYFNPDDLLESRVDADSIRARGFLKHRHNYTPSLDVQEKVENAAKSILSAAKIKTEDVLEYKFEDGKNEVKFELLTKLGRLFNHWPGNAKLLHFETVKDVVDFYSTPVQNITSYSQMARSENKPKNVHILEQAVRFNPEDTEMYHGGVTAFPGTGGEVFSLRQKRLLRQFRPKKDWFDYEDQTFEYSKVDKDMPWDPEVARQMDRYPDKRYNLQTKKFTRIRN
ncbi:unnamed protein product [Caenorhabditis auriculariae]|uniref:Large ribosomal subunit protein mL50 n=1 Tax=Caenorhabditis auriculariae TaxID=2777116 RepID=A0A8S1H868_9PELO|nr:unnamed protein product [Caenorhabditis auriculariae]